MEKITTIGLDLAKSVFQVHGVNAAGGVVVRRKLRRSALLDFFAALSPTLVGMEACGRAHHWARELTRLGHTVRLMPPAYVKPYVKRGKTDAADTEAICEAVTRPTMRFVPEKSRGAAGQPNGAEGPRHASAPAHPDHQRTALPPHRIRHRDRAGVQARRADRGGPRR
ncbi:transposase [Roseicella sp. DB1501]|nr:transposase [Roseicella sp. DB1501]